MGDGVIRTSFSMDHKAVYAKPDEKAETEYSVIAVKWHKHAPAVLVMEHIARQMPMRIGSVLI